MLDADWAEARHAARKYLVLPEEDAAEFAGLEAALIAELAPAGALQMVLARRVAVAAAAHPLRPAARPPLAERAQPNEPERIAERRLEYLLPEPPASGALHEPAAPWLPNEPEAGPARTPRKTSGG